MNYTFLPQSERNKLKREYRVRALVVLFFVLSVAVLIGVTGLFPTYLNSRLVEQSELAKIAEIDKSNNESGLELIKSQLNKDASLLGHVEESLATPLFYPLIKDVIVAKGSVKITSIAVPSYSTSTIDILVQGFAPTRESLITYKTRLESALPGSIVTLPLSDLAKNKDILFSLKLTHSISI